MEKAAQTPALIAFMISKSLQWASGIHTLASFLLCFVIFRLLLATSEGCFSNWAETWLDQDDLAIAYEGYRLAAVFQVWLMTLVAFLIGLPMLKDAVAFAAVSSISVIGLYITYGLVIFFKLFLAHR